jgi:hypothetical protein
MGLETTVCGPQGRCDRLKPPKESAHIADISLSSLTAHSVGVSVTKPPTSGSGRKEADGMKRLTTMIALSSLILTLGAGVGAAHEITKNDPDDANQPLDIKKITYRHYKSRSNSARLGLAPRKPRTRVTFQTHDPLSNEDVINPHRLFVGLDTSPEKNKTAFPNDFYIRVSAKERPNGSLQITCPLYHDGFLSYGESAKVGSLTAERVDSRTVRCTGLSKLVGGVAEAFNGTSIYDEESDYDHTGTVEHGSP